MITNAEIYDKVNNLLMEAVKMNYDIHRLLGAVLEVKKENLNSGYFDTDTIAAMTSKEARAVLNKAYGVMSSMPASPSHPPYWNIEPDHCYFSNGMNKAEYYSEYFDSDLIGILPADCDISIVPNDNLRELACALLKKAIGFAPSPQLVTILSKSHAPYMNYLEFGIDEINGYYRVEICKSEITLIIYGDEELVGEDDENATIYVVAEYPEYDEEEDYGYVRN